MLNPETAPVLAFQDVELTAFRGLRDIHLESCGAMNLLVGGNNSGKTSVLEALMLYADPTSIPQWEAAVELRARLADGRRPVSGGSPGRLQSISWLFPRELEGRVLLRPVVPP